MDHGGAMDSSSEHSSRASPVANSPKNPGSPGQQQQQQQQQQQSSREQQQQQQQQQLHASMSGVHQQPHPRDQLRDHTPVSGGQPGHPRGVPTPGSPTRGSPPQGLPLSPPPLSGGAGGTPTGMVPRMPGLPPPGLGLLGSLGGMLSGHHGSPLELMAAHHAVMPPRNYSSPPPISSSDPTANECQLVDYRGQKVAAFIIANETMLCLPQAFELFLKHLVGGLHTVYTKLKRLDIVPLVCNVEQVRILRGLGAIQPGVNRCKLLSCKDFDTLYRDCTTARYVPGSVAQHTSSLSSSSSSSRSEKRGTLRPPPPPPPSSASSRVPMPYYPTAYGISSRPGRPPKRASVSLSSLAASHLAATAGHHAAAHQLKKHRLDNGDYYENGHLEVPRLDKSPLLSNGYNHPPTHLSHMQFMQLGGHPGAGHTAMLSPASLPHHLQAQAQARAAEQGLKVNHNMANMDAFRPGTLFATYEDIVEQLKRIRDERGESDRALALDHKQRDHSSHNGSSNGHSPVLNLSKTAGSGSVGEHSGSEAGASHRSQDEEEEEDNLSEDLEDDNVKDEEMSDVPENLPLAAPGSESPQALNYSQIASAAQAVSQASAGGQDSTSVSSTENMLRNIQSLLKVAADNARKQENKINYEKAELYTDFLREKQDKESLERQLRDEQKIRVVYQKRFKKEKRIRKQIQDQLDLELRRGKKLEDALKATGATPEQVRSITETLNLEQQSRSRSVEPSEDSPTGSGGPAPERSSQSSSSQSSTRDQQQREQQKQREQQQQAAAVVAAVQAQQQQYREVTQAAAVAAAAAAAASRTSGSQPQSSSSQQSSQQPQQPASTPEKPGGWGGFSGLDLINSQASTFWQNYSESLAELELERKSRQHPSTERDQVKSPLQGSRTDYYKNVLFTSAT